MGHGQGTVAILSDALTTEALRARGLPVVTGMEKGHKALSGWRVQ